MWDRAARRVRAGSSALATLVVSSALAFAACGGQSLRRDACRGSGCGTGGVGGVGGATTGGTGVGGTGGVGGAGGVGGTATGGAGGASGGSGGVGARAGAAGAPGLPLYACDGEPSYTELKRLTLTDINRALDDTLGQGEPLGGSWPDERVSFQSGTYPEQAKELVRMARVRSRQYASSHSIACALDDSGCLDNQISALASKLLRRPLTAVEIAALRELYTSEAERADAQVALAVLLETLIESPYFVFRVEVGSSGALTSYELAVRLAFFLWRSAPDDELRAAAEAGLLQDDASLQAQAVRMLADPRADFGMTRLVEEWLGLGPFTLLAGVVGVPEVVAADMSEQTSRFVSDLFASSDPTLKELLLATHSPLTEPLAEHYGMAGGAFDSLDRFRDVELDPNAFSGILTHGTFLVSHRTPSQRGYAILSRLECVEIGVPPPHTSVPLPDAPTRREQYESLTQPECRSCHQLIDRVGFGLEAFDEAARPQGGRTDGGLYDFDIAQETPFEGPRGLAELLLAKYPVSRCTARRIFEYALDAPAPEDVALIGIPNPAPPPLPPSTVIDCLTELFLADGGNLVDLVVGTALSRPFRKAPPSIPSAVGVIATNKPIQRPLDETRSLIDAYAEPDRAPLTAYFYSLELAFAELDDTGGTAGASGAGP